MKYTISTDDEVIARALIEFESLLRDNKDAWSWLNFFEKLRQWRVHETWQLLPSRKANRSVKRFWENVEKDRAQYLEAGRSILDFPPVAVRVAQGENSSRLSIEQVINAKLRDGFLRIRQLIEMHCVAELTPAVYDFGRSAEFPSSQYLIDSLGMDWAEIVDMAIKNGEGADFRSPDLLRPSPDTSG